MTISIKTGNINFEQFDGSDEMCRRYHILYVIQCIPKDNSYCVTDGQLNLVHSNFKIKINGENVKISVWDWIATGENGKRWIIKDAKDSDLMKDYTNLPTISPSVEKYLEYCKSCGTLADPFVYVENNDPSGSMDSEVLYYLVTHSEDFAIAWVKGYKVKY